MPQCKRMSHLISCCLTPCKSDCLFSNNLNSCQCFNQIKSWKLSCYVLARTEYAVEYFDKTCTVHHLCYESIMWDERVIFCTCLFHLKLFAVFLTGLCSITIARQPVTRWTPWLNPWETMMKHPTVKSYDTVLYKLIFLSGRLIIKQTEKFKRMS